MINRVLSILHVLALSDSSVVLFGRHVIVKVMFPEALHNKCADFASYNAEII